MADRHMPILHVCTTCRAGRDLAEGETPRGEMFFDAIAMRLADDAPVALAPVKCLSTCARGCAAAISMPGKWTYLLGDLDLPLVDDLLEYARAYTASASGAVLPSRRPESLRNVIVGRIPALETA